MRQFPTATLPRVLIVIDVVVAVTVGIASSYGRRSSPMWRCSKPTRGWKVCGNEKDLSVSRGTAGFRKRNTHCILGARTRGKEKKGGREGWSLKAWASRNSDVAFGLETTRTSGSCSLGGHDWPVCYHMGFAVTTKYLKPHRAVRIAFLDSPSSFVSENVASLRRMRLDYSSHSTSTVSYNSLNTLKVTQAGYSLNIHGCATLSRALQTSLFRTEMIIEAPIDPDHSKLSLGAQTLPCAETMTAAAKERRDHAL
ncbi:hypothetical protein G5I_11528 [Acromyrmex echinatior]|uniref:Uncharacterized protein n=1 Tax=Acromyrmex echinatior TaxID=103372 RepID=F4WZS0_ACREC|nr:hypothetical protein G5I_11528 [Acromyrmex echinatior]